MCGRQAEAGLRRAVEGSKRLREQGLEVVEQTIDDVTEVRQRGDEHRQDRCGRST